MGCGCGEQKKKGNRAFPKAVIEINNPEKITTLRKVVIPASLGDESNVPASIGKYSNVILEYEANGHVYIYSSDGIPTLLTSDVMGDLEERIDSLGSLLTQEVSDREGADTQLQDNINEKQNIISSENMLNADYVNDSTSAHKFVSSSDLSTLSTALQPADINYTVMADLDVDSNPSTSLVQLDAAKVNLQSGATSTKNIPLPVASATQAGVMNSALFNAVSSNTANINALLGGAVSVTGLPASPTQTELTTAWQTETGLTNLINRAQIYDVTNSKIWTYYTNSSTWFEAPAGGSISISTFTNSSEGTILGSTNAGQVFAENDGTGSVNGWDALSAAVSDNTANKLASANLTADGGLSKTSSGSGASTAVNLSIADGGVSTAKIADGAITTAKFAQYAANKAVFTADDLQPSSDTTAAWTTLLGAPGVYWTRYDTLNMFTNQPSRHGFLETVLSGNEVYQRWHTQGDGVDYYRCGNVNGWYNSGTAAGTFRKIIDTSQSKTVTNTMIADAAVTKAKTNMDTFRKVLYNNTTGTNGTVTLSETSANFTYLDIFYHDNNNDHGHVRVYSPNGKRAILMAGWAGDSSTTNYNHKIKTVNISGNKITTYGYVEAHIDGTLSKVNYIYIDRVEGWY